LQREKVFLKFEGKIHIVVNSCFLFKKLTKQGILQFSQDFVEGKGDVQKIICVSVYFKG
jgi:hypothetical protein